MQKRADLSVDLLPSVFFDDIPVQQGLIGFVAVLVER